MTKPSRIGGIAAVALFACGMAGNAGGAEAAKAGKPDHAMAHGGGGMMHDMSIRLSIADGAVLTKRPTAVRFDFAPAMRLRAIALTNAAGERIPVAIEPKMAAAAVTVSFAALEPDTYILAFSADAGDHDMPGKIRFTVR